MEGSLSARWMTRLVLVQRYDHVAKMANRPVKQLPDTTFSHLLVDFSKALSTLRRRNLKTELYENALRFCVLAWTKNISVENGVCENDDNAIIM